MMWRPDGMEVREGGNVVPEGAPGDDKSGHLASRSSLLITGSAV